MQEDITDFEFAHAMCRRLRQLVLPSSSKVATLRKISWQLLHGALGHLTCTGPPTMPAQDSMPEGSLHDRLLDNDLPRAAEGAAPANVKLELKALSLLSAPVVVQLTALYAISTVNQYFIGHLGAAPLAAAAIGKTVSPLISQSSRFASKALGRSRTRRSVMLGCMFMLCSA